MSGLVYSIHAETTTTNRKVFVTRHQRLNNELSQQINGALAEQGVQLERNPHGRGWRLRSATGHTSVIDTNDNHFETLSLTCPLR